MVNIISFCLWGNTPKYTMGAIKNAEIALTLYPGWICRFYIGRSVPQEIIDKLLEFNNTDIVLMDSEGDWTSMLWRFLPASDPDVDIMISRDTDSRLSLREKEAVDEWIHSNYEFHIMRDHPDHTTEILGGMWGAKKGVLNDMADLVAKFPQNNKYGTDQIFLRDYVYPLIKSKSMVHDEFFQYDFNRRDFPSVRKNFEFVGEIFDEYDNRQDHWKILCSFFGGDSKVAFLIPSTRLYRKDWTCLEDTYFYKYILQSLRNDPMENSTIYLGIDKDDQEYKDFFKSVDNICIIDIDDSLKGSVAQIWNVLYQQAYDDGYDYFVQCGDDISFSKNFVPLCIRALKKSNDIGVAGPVDVNNKKLLTQTVVSRKHMEIFGRYFPTEIKNWYCDNWINEVYRYVQKLFITGHVKNEGGAERYRIEKMDIKYLVERDKVVLKKYTHYEDIIGLVVVTHNRPNYLHQLLCSLSGSELNVGSSFNVPVHMIIVDDCSTNDTTKNIIKKFVPFKNVKSSIVVFNGNNIGIHNSLKKGFDYCVNIGCTLLVNLDSDVLVKPNFLSTLVHIYHKYNQPPILTGYNSIQHKTLLVAKDDDMAIKASCGGCNLFMPRYIYTENIRQSMFDILFDWRICQYLQACCTIPSVIQHIGFIGMNSNLNMVDIAIDF